ncbi:MAG: hypothetical protein L0154_01915 [Chloroflexi bacterium]|nr:hypothetical protein [Chloroflexota bacterium]
MMKKKVSDVEKEGALERLPYSLQIEIHSETKFKKLAQAVLRAVHRPVELADTNPIVVPDANGSPKLEIIQLDDKYLTDTLRTDKAVDERIDYIKQKYAPANVPTGTLVELPDYRNKQLRLKDPKSAIREGLTLTGRISQFLVPEHESPNYTHRNTKAVADLLRMMGYRYRPFYRYDKRRTLPEQLDILAFYVFQLNKSRSVPFLASVVKAAVMLTLSSSLHDFHKPAIGT